MSRLLLLTLTVFLLSTAALTPAVALSDERPTLQADAQSLLREGVEAFKKGDLDRARRLLEQARAAGLESAALHYNLGVLYYRSGHYELSRQAFLKLLGSHKDLASYNLGLIAQAEGNEAVALDRFRQVLATAEQQNLRRLAELQLQGQPESQLGTAAKWLGLASLSSGHESNLALRPDSAASGLSDGFTDILLAGQGPVLDMGSSDDSTRALQLSANIYRRHYHSESEFSSDAAQLGLSWVSRGATVQQEVGLRQSYFRLGGEPREMHTSLVLQYQRDACVYGHFQGRCRVSVTASRVQPFDGFEPYEGMRYLAEASYRHAWSHWQATGRLGLEFNNREDISEGDQFVSLSPRRQAVALELTYAGWAPWTFGGEVGYRYSDYPDPYQLVSGDDWESGRRVEHRYRVELMAEHALSRSWTFTGSARYQDNHSTLKQYQYENEVYQLGLDYLF